MNTLIATHPLICLSYDIICLEEKLNNAAEQIGEQSLF